MLIIYNVYPFAICITFYIFNTFKITKNIHITGENLKMMCIYFFMGVFWKIRILRFLNKNHNSIKYALKGDDTTTG